MRGLQLLDGWAFSFQTLHAKSGYGDAAYARGPVLGPFLCRIRLRVWSYFTSGRLTLTLSLPRPVADEPMQSDQMAEKAFAGIPIRIVGCRA